MRGRLAARESESSSAAEAPYHRENIHYRGVESSTEASAFVITAAIKPGLVNSHLGDKRHEHGHQSRIPPMTDRVGKPHLVVS